MMKRIGCMGMVLVMLAMLLVPSLTVMAASPVTATYSLALSRISGPPSSEFTVTLSMQLSEAAVLSGMHFAFEFDESRFTYKNGTATMKHSHLEDAAVYYNEDGKVSVIWTSEDKIKMPKSFEVMSLQFKVDADAATGDADIVATMLDLYSSSTSAGQLNITSLNYAPSTGVSFKVTELDTAVRDVINLINAIGPVTYSQESNEKISQAETAYTTLGYEQKALVSNYETLTTARATYDRLKEEALAAEALEKEVSQFKEDHKDALELSTDIINNSTDKAGLLEAVDNALEAYKNLSLLAQSELFSVKSNLQSYKTLLEKLIADAEEAAKQEQYQNEAQEFIDTFLNDHVYTLTLTPETVRSYDEEIVNKAWTAYDTMKDLPDVGIYIQEGLIEEAALLGALKEKIAKLKAEENPELSEEILAAEDWKTRFSSVLALDPEALTYEDVFDVKLAKAILDLQDEKVLALLTEEAAILEVLYEKALTIEPEQVIVDNIITDYVEVEKLVEVEVEKVVDKYQPLGGIFNLGIKNRQVGPFIWILLILNLLSAMFFIVSRIFWNLLVKKGGQANENK